MGFLWFKSKKEKEQEKLDLVQAVTASVQDLFKEQEEKPYVKVILSNNTLTVVTADGDLLTHTDASRDLYEAVKAAKTSNEIRGLMLTPKSQAELDLERRLQREQEEKIEKRLLTEAILDTLKAHPDFEYRNGSLYMKNIDLSLPEIMVVEFERALSMGEDNYRALKNFWYWLALNPNPESREDAFIFVKDNDIKITPMGLLVLYRRIVPIKDTGDGKKLLEFVSTEFAKIKIWKKAPRNYEVVMGEGGYKVVKSGAQLELSDYIIGNLQDLYVDLPNMEANKYTDAHTKTMEIKIGTVYSIPEEEVDRDNSRDCSNGLHVASKNYDYGGFGDTPVLVLVNPMKIRAVPTYSTGKMRVSEMLIVAKLEFGQYGKYMDTDVDLVDMDELYFNIGVDQLEELAKNVNVTELHKHDLLPAVSLPSIVAITEYLVSEKEAISKRVQYID